MRNMNKKRIGIIAGGMAVAMLLGGCGGESENAAKPEEKQTIRITYSAGELDGQSTDLDLIFEDFYKEHPNCEVVLEENGSALMAKIAANDAPDIIRASNLIQLPTYVNKNIVMPLDDLLAESALYDESDIYPLCIDMFRYDGKEFGKGSIYGLPKDWSPSAMWVNKSMFEEAGIPIPTTDNPMTYTELADAAQKLSKKNGNEIAVYGLGDSTDLQTTAEQMLNLQGSSMWSEDFKTVNLKDETVRAVFESIYNLQVNGYRNSALYPIGASTTSAFSKGNVAINMVGLYAANTYNKGTDRVVDLSDIVFCPSPVYEKDQRLTMASATGATISASTKDVDLAFACWEYIHLGALSDRRAGSGFNLAIRKSLCENVVLENEFLTDCYRYAMDLAEEEYLFMRSNPYLTAESVSGVMEKYWTPLLFGQYSFDEALSIIESELQLLIDEGAAN